MKNQVFEKVLFFVALLFIFAMNKGGQVCMFVPDEHNTITSLDSSDYSSILFMALGFTIVYYKSKISIFLNQILKKSNG